MVKPECARIYSGTMDGEDVSKGVRVIRIWR
jgi:hypothetical protein